MATGIDQFYPYRDPRTAYGQGPRIRGLEVTELADKPSAQTGVSTGEPPQTGVRPSQQMSKLSISGPLARAGGVAIGAVPEAIDVGRVLANRGTTGIDVATQAAEGVGRMASAGAGAMGGAKLGAMAAPFLGPLAPLAPLAGAVVGGIGGYWAGNRAIDGGRRAVGADPRSPVGRLPVESGAGAGRGVVNPPNAAPSAGGVDGAGAGRGSINPLHVNPNAPSTAATAPGVILKDGNSYSGTNVEFNPEFRNRQGAIIQPRGTLTVLPGRGADVAGIEARTAAIEAGNAELRRELDASGPGLRGGGIAGIGGETLSSAANHRFNNTPSDSVLPLQGQSVDQLAALNAAAREGERTRSVTTRGQDMTLLGQRETRGAQIDAANIQGRSAVDVANIGADARMTAAERQANARALSAELAASSRVAAAEAGAKRYTVVPGGQEVIDIGGMPATIKRPDRVFDNTTGKFADVQDVEAKAKPPAGAVKMLRDNPKLAADFDAKYGKGAAAAALAGK